LDDKAALTGRFYGAHVERKERSDKMDTEEFSGEEMAADILEAHERELFDDVMEALQ
jgi:hypothetical protein